MKTEIKNNICLNPELIDVNTPYDHAEYHPVKDVSPSEEECTMFEQCESSEADMWSVYLHIPEQGLECIADCSDSKTASDLAEMINRLLTIKNA